MTSENPMKSARYPSETTFKMVLPNKKKLNQDSVAVFEARFADLIRLRHAIAFAYARTALYSILSAMGLGPGDEIILSPLTCKVVPLTLLSLKLSPVYADISPHTLNLNPASVESSIGSATRAVLFQYTYGNLAGAEAVAEVAARHGLLLIEDCAQCIPYSNGKASPGGIGQAAIFSNNLRKPLPAGSGGFAVTNDDELAKRILEIRDNLPHRRVLAEVMLRVEILAHKHLLLPRLYWPLFELNRKLRLTYRVQSVGSEIASEITSQALQVSDHQLHEGFKWLAKVERNVNHRQNCFSEYARSLHHVENLELPCEGSPKPLYYFPVLVHGKEELLKKARERYTELIAWPLQTPIYPVEKESDLPTYGYRVGTCPIAEDVATRLVGLPMDTRITAHERMRTIDLLQTWRKS